MNYDPYFSDSYFEAREKFRSACFDADLSLTCFINPIAKGPAGEWLSMDMAWIGPRDAEAVLLNLSGTHGNEGFAGSAAQTAWIESGAYADLPDNVAICMVHAVNPFGFATYSRYTENNVDLNRNWIDFDQPLPENEKYVDYYSLITPEKLTTRIEEDIWVEIQRHMDQKGRWEVEDTLSRGQYTHPDGSSFGGSGPEWSRQTLSDILQTHLRQAKNIALIDWHTGTPGVGEIIFLCYAPQVDPMYARTASFWGKANIDPGKVQKQWGNKRPGRSGLMYFGLREIVEAQGAELAGGVVEIGTREKGDRMGPARASLYDRYLRYEEEPTAEEKERMIAEIMKCYYRPDSNAWKKAAIEKTSVIYDKTLKGLSKWLNESS